MLLVMLEHINIGRVMIAKNVKTIKDTWNIKNNNTKYRNI